MVTRGAVQAEGVEGGFSAAYRVLSAFEDSGQARRGYVVEGLGAAQFAMDGAVDRLRAARHGPGPGARSASDRPAGGASWRPPTRPTRTARRCPGPSRPTGAGHKPGRKAGSLVVLVDGELTLYLERGGKTLLAWADRAGRSRRCGPPRRRSPAAARAGALGTVTVERANGDAALTSPLGRALEAAGFHRDPAGAAAARLSPTRSTWDRAVPGALRAGSTPARHPRVRIMDPCPKATRSGRPRGGCTRRSPGRC